MGGTTNRPNVLWLMTDEHRTDSLGVYGSPWAASPAIDALARTGSTFMTAVTPSPVCMSARTTMLTGLYPHQTGIWTNGSTLYDLPHLTARFVEHGYRTANFGKQHYGSTHQAFQTTALTNLSGPVGYTAYEGGYDEADFDVVRYPGQPWQWVLAGRYPEAADTTLEARCVAAAKGWLDEVAGEAPWLLRVSFNGPHTPVVPPAPYDTAIDPDAIAIPPDTEAMPAVAPSWVRDLARVAGASVLGPAQVRRLRQAYYGEVQYLDTLVADLLGWMDERGLLDDTYVVFVSDHGTHLGDFGLVQKQTYYEPVVNVPYFLCGPDVVAQRVDRPVETRSLLPTLLDLVGIGAPPHVADASLAATARGDEPAPDRPVFSALRWEGERVVMVRDGAWKLTLRLDPEPCDRVLTDLVNDPYERTNALDAAPDVASSLEQVVLAHLSG